MQVGPARAVRLASKPASSRTSLTRVFPKSLKATSGAPKPVKEHPVLDFAVKGWERIKGQNYNAASASSNLRSASRQFRNLLGTGLATGLGTTGIYLGFAASGLRAAGGIQLLTGAIKKRDVQKGLDGVRDLGSAAVLGLLSAGKFALRRTVLPATAGFNTFRGAFNFAAGWKAGDKKRQSQGALDGVRSLGQTARSLQRFSPWLLVGGKVLAPVAGALQINQGLKSLSTGLTQNKNKLELKGLVDITSAVGMTMLLTGVAATPGLAIFSAAQGLYSIYSMSKTVRKFVDVGIDKLEPTGLKALTGLKGIKHCLRDQLEKIGNPFPALFRDKDPETEAELRGTSARLEEDGWEAYVAIWADSEHVESVSAVTEESDFADSDLAFA